MIYLFLSKKNKHFSFKLQDILRKYLSQFIFFSPKSLCPFVFLSKCSLTIGCKLWYWQLLHIIQYLTFQLNITILTKFRIFSVPVAFVPKIDEVWHPVWAALPTSPRAGMILALSGEGDAGWKRITLLSGITASLDTCLPSQLKHCLTDFTLQSKT